MSAEKTSTRWADLSSGRAVPALCVQQPEATYLLYVEDGCLQLRSEPARAMLGRPVTHAAYSVAQVVAYLQRVNAKSTNNRWARALLQHVADGTFAAFVNKPTVEDYKAMSDTKLPPIDPPQSEPRVKHPENLPDQSATDSSPSKGRAKAKAKTIDDNSETTTTTAQEGNTMSKKTTSKKATKKAAVKKVSAKVKGGKKAELKTTAPKSNGATPFREGSLKATVFPVYAKKAEAYAKMSRAERAEWLEATSKEYGVAVSTLRTMISGCFSAALRA